MVNPRDRRVRKTEEQLVKGLTKLMKTKSIKNITVRELADEVDINRSTFYLHYKDIFDMADRLIDHHSEHPSRFSERYFRNNLP